MSGSGDFQRAVEQIMGELQKYGYADAHIEKLPADGKTFYGTQRSRPAWDADFAELWEVDAAKRLASWDAAPITLAEDSESADVTAELIDVGECSSENDYLAKELKGKIVLAGSQAEGAARVAVRQTRARGGR